MQYTEEDNEGIIILALAFVIIVALVYYTGTMPDNVVAGAILSLR
jgi:hypothetical protein